MASKDQASRPEARSCPALLGTPTAKLRRRLKRHAASACVEHSTQCKPLLCLGCPMPVEAASSNQPPHLRQLAAVLLEVHPRLLVALLQLLADELQSASEMRVAISKPQEGQQRLAQAARHLASKCTDEQRSPWPLQPSHTRSPPEPRGACSTQPGRLQVGKSGGTSHSSRRLVRRRFAAAACVSLQHAPPWAPLAKGLIQILLARPIGAPGGRRARSESARSAGGPEEAEAHRTCSWGRSRPAQRAARRPPSPWCRRCCPLLLAPGPGLTRARGAGMVWCADCFGGRARGRV